MVRKKKAAPAAPPTVNVYAEQLARRARANHPERGDYYQVEVFRQPTMTYSARSWGLSSEEIGPRWEKFGDGSRLLSDLTATYVEAQGMYVKARIKKTTTEFVNPHE